MKLALALLATAPAATVAAGNPFPSYLGCYVDGDPIRDLPIYFCRSDAGDHGYPPFNGNCGDGYAHSWAGSSRMAPQLCSTLCADYKYFGVQYGYECFCGNAYGSQGNASDSDCNTACYGDSSTMCGGAGRNSVYAQPTSTGGDAGLYTELQANATATKRN
jgi:hypothetical protein